MEKYRKVLLFLLDSVGVGELPDAAAYGDLGAATVQHTLEYNPWLRLPNLERLGLFAIPSLEKFSSGVTPVGKYGKCREVSAGKDSIVGHWEVMGYPTARAFDTFPQGFPKDLMDAFEAAIGRKALCNELSSGTVLLDRLGETHQKTGLPMVYTSVDSVFQIAAHEDIVPPAQLYDWCRAAKKAAEDLGYNIGRVIARPFVGEPGHYTRTANRHDFAARPAGDTDLERLERAGIPFHSIGKPADIFPEAGFTSARRTGSNTEGIAAALEALGEKDGLIFVNLLDYDQVWGHRRDTLGYARGLKEFDDAIPRVLEKLGERDLLIITADHGCDPAHHGTDHTREYIPFLLYSPGITPGSLGVRDTFADVGATVLDALGAEVPEGRYSAL
jgi:phosphopentomutase